MGGGRVGLRSSGRSLGSGAADRSHVDGSLAEREVGLAGRESEVVVTEAALSEAEAVLGVESGARVDALALGVAEVVLDVKLKEGLECGEAVVGRHQLGCIERL